MSITAISRLTKTTQGNPLKKHSDLYSQGYIIVVRLWYSPPRFRDNMAIQAVAATISNVHCHIKSRTSVVMNKIAHTILYIGANHSRVCVVDITSRVSVSDVKYVLCYLRIYIFYIWQKISIEWQTSHMSLYSVSIASLSVSVDT